MICRTRRGRRSPNAIVDGRREIDAIEGSVAPAEVKSNVNVKESWHSYDDNESHKRDGRSLAESHRLSIRREMEGKGSLRGKEKVQLT